jgi:hypothetical protein
MLDCDTATTDSRLVMVVRDPFAWCWHPHWKYAVMDRARAVVIRGYSITM